MDNDLISRSALIEWFSPYMHEDEAISPDVVIGDIKAAPAVDAVPVVRCCKCEYSWFRLAEPYSRYCKHTGLNVGDHDFCSYGERMADNA